MGMLVETAQNADAPMKTPSAMNIIGLLPKTSRNWP